MSTEEKQIENMIGNEGVGWVESKPDGYAENISIARDRSHTKESCKKNPLSLVNGDELAIQCRSAGIGKKAKEEINDARGYPVFMAVAQ